MTKLDPFRSYVTRRLAAAAETIPASVLLSELRERGYAGGRETCSRAPIRCGTSVCGLYASEHPRHKLAEFKSRDADGRPRGRAPRPDIR